MLITCHLFGSYLEGILVKERELILLLESEVTEKVEIDLKWSREIKIIWD